MPSNPTHMLRDGLANSSWSLEHPDHLAMSASQRISGGVGSALVFTIPAPAHWLAEPTEPIKTCHCHNFTSS